MLPLTGARHHRSDRLRPCDVPMRAIADGLLVPASATAARVPRACVLRVAASVVMVSDERKHRADVMSSVQTLPRRCRCRRPAQNRSARTHTRRR